MQFFNLITEDESDQMCSFDSNKSKVSYSANTIYVPLCENYTNLYTGYM